MKYCINWWLMSLVFGPNTKKKKMYLPRRIIQSLSHETLWINHDNKNTELNNIKYISKTHPSNLSEECICNSRKLFSCSCSLFCYIEYFFEIGKVSEKWQKINDASVYCWQVRKWAWIIITHPSCEFIASIWILS